MEAMQRGAEVVAIDLSPTLVQLARDRSATVAPNGNGGSVQFLSGDMLDDALGHFDHMVAMDSVIHYDTPDIARAIQRMAARTRASVLFTIAPSSPMLSVMHSVGRLFPRSDRSPALTPVCGCLTKLTPAAITSLDTWTWPVTSDSWFGYSHLCG